MNFPAKAGVTLAASAALASCTTLDSIPTERIAEARLTLANGIPAGTVQILAAGETLTLAVAVTGISPGEHGFHLHTVGQCTAPDFKSAGGHLNPLGQKHGKLNEDGMHVGDLLNLMVNSSGTGSTTIDLDGSRSQLSEWLFDVDGTAVVVHAGPDDYRSDPAGAAGPRIACGVLTRS